MPQATETTESRKKRRWASRPWVWVVAFVVLAVGYPLSLGPVNRLLASGYIPERHSWPVLYLYEPIVLLYLRLLSSENPAANWLGEAYSQYLTFWLDVGL